MAYGIMRVQKVNGAGNLKGICNEHDRTASMKEKAELEGHFSASKINWSKTDSNIVLKRAYEHRAWENSAWGYEKNLLEEVGIKPRKNAVLMHDTLYTASPEFFEGKSQEEIKAYFESCLEFHEKEWGTVVDAVIHMDEKTPHLHILSIPLVNDPEKGLKLSAKQICDGRVEMRNKQNKFFDEVSKQYDLERGEVKDFREIKKHETAQEHRVKELSNFLDEQYNIFQKDLKAHKERIKGIDEEIQNKGKIVERAKNLAVVTDEVKEKINLCFDYIYDNYGIDLTQDQETLEELFDTLYEELDDLEV